MLERLDVWLAIITLAALAWYELRLGRFVMPIVRGVASLVAPATEQAKRRAGRRLPTTVRLKSRPIRDARGRFDGSLPAVTSAGNDAQLRFQDVTASERGVTGSNDVAEVTVSPEEAAIIGARLGRGMPPSAVVKSLPGYSPKKNYDLYKAKVDHVRSVIQSVEPVEEIQQVA